MPVITVSRADQPRAHRQDGSSSLGVRCDHHNAKATGVLSRSNTVSKKLTLGSEGLHQEQNQTDQKVEVREQKPERRHRLDHRDLPNLLKPPQLGLRLWQESQSSV